MSVKEEVIDILNTITGEDVSDKMDENLFEDGLLDSMATVELLLDLVVGPMSYRSIQAW